ncbi:MAG: NADH-quinone oxidoreductase subunit C [Nocardioides sp.]|uniref:hydrogenase large subunit n=1 Tax=Nocardioides sp. TaxID=35761 RepID=UPI0039E3A342
MTASVPVGPRGRLLALGEWEGVVRSRVGAGSRLAGLYGTDEEGSCQLTALLADADRLEVVSTIVAPDRDGVICYPSLSRDVPAAFWYERALHDLSGVVPLRHPRLDPLLLDRAGTSPAPLPGAPASETTRPTIGERPGPVDVAGHGMFTLPLGPVRSGVFESIEFLIETPGEDIPHLNVRPHYKHRGIAKQFESRPAGDAVLVAERVEGISSVAHALAFCHAIETLGDLEVPAEARLVRTVLAELERISNHLDVTMRLADAAGLAVATSRFGWHKERVMRLLSELCRSRFGRGTVTVGGLSRGVRIDAPALTTELRRLDQRIRADVAALESSASFLDRLRTTGPLEAQVARRYGALGPIGRASGVDNDVRRERPYDGYLDLAPVPRPRVTTGDVLARARVRWHELTTSHELAIDALEMLGSRDVAPLAAPAPAPPDGLGVGAAESAQGEVVHAVEISRGVVRRCFARSASFHNLVLFHDVFAGDVFTDFPFIEASFGLGYAGVAM